jgi:hypothetical protein
VHATARHPAKPAPVRYRRTPATSGPAAPSPT